MVAVVDILSWACIVSGAGFSLIGALGLVRLPVVFARMHGTGIIDTLGVGLIFIGLMFHAGFRLILAKLILVLLFILFTSPTATHALARAALRGGVDPLASDHKEEPPGRKSEKGAASSKT